MTPMHQMWSCYLEQHLAVCLACKRTSAGDYYVKAPCKMLPRMAHMRCQSDSLYTTPRLVLVPQYRYLYPIQYKQVSTFVNRLLLFFVAKQYSRPRAAFGRRRGDLFHVQLTSWPYRALSAGWEITKSRCIFYYLACFPALNPKPCTCR
jgi:hypothetical protein